jgi:hypothetical protein
MIAITTNQAAVLSIDELRVRLSQPPKKVKNHKILWAYRGSVEEGDVLFVHNDVAEVLWLEGYKSRNDSVALAEILSLYDPDAPKQELHPFSGNSHFTEAGLKWLAAHPNPER